MEHKEAERMTGSYHVLVVDDEQVAREAAQAAFTDAGLECQAAGDGVEAMALLDRVKFDAVVADLRMPRLHGHALAVEMLSRGPERPVIVVLTAVHEAKLVKDLIARGVDDVAIKPVDLDLFVAKVAALCERRRSVPIDKFRDPIRKQGLMPVTTWQLEQRLDALAGAIPVSPAAVEIANLLHQQSPPVARVAELVAREALLAVEVLRLANSSQFAVCGKRVDDLCEAITRVGDRQIGELALAAATSSSLRVSELPWIDCELMRRRGIAASLALTHLRPTAALGTDDEGLFLASLLLPMSRVILGLALPELYSSMIEQCSQSGCSLASLERQLLPLSPAHAMAGMLSRWGLSPRLCKPLQFAGLPFAEAAALTEPVRSKVFQLRAAEQLGQMAAARFYPWDEIDFPPGEFMCRIRAPHLGTIVDEVRSEMGQFAEGAPAHEVAIPRRPCPNIGSERALSYCKLNSETHDWLAVLAESLGFRLEHVSRELACQARPALVNGLYAPTERLEWLFESAVPDCRRVIICNASLPVSCQTWGPVIALPDTFRTISEALHSICQSAPHDQPR
jgi:DNA-binding response OmpR family regulator